MSKEKWAKESSVSIQSHSSPLQVQRSGYSSTYCLCFAFFPLTQLGYGFGRRKVICIMEDEMCIESKIWSINAIPSTNLLIQV